MKRACIIVLGLLPAFAGAVVCKSVAPDGSISFHQVEGEKCDMGVAMPEYSGALQAEEPDRAASNLAQPEQEEDAYDSVQVIDPADKAVVRRNDGTFDVKLALKPKLSSGHYLSVFVDGKKFPGQFGSDKVRVTGIERGTHKLRATVTDSRGRVVAQTEETQFTLHGAPSRIQVKAYDQVNQALVGRVSGPVVSEQDLASLPQGSNAFEVEVTVKTPDGESTYTGNIEKSDGSWSVEIPYEVLREAVKVLIALDESGRPDTTGVLGFDKTEDVRRTLGAVTGTYDYRDVPPADYTPAGTGISTTPGQINPAFKPNYSR